MSLYSAMLLDTQYVVTLLCVPQGLLSVTEELHSLSFEACFTVQGLTIDLEVRSSNQISST